MKTYARVVDGVAVEIIDPFAGPDGLEVPIEERFTADLVAQMVEWEAGKPLPEPAEPPPSAPQSVTMRQARLALLAADKLHLVDAAIGQLPTPEKESAQIEWDYAATVDRESPMVAMLGSMLALDDHALDALFAEAAQL